MKHLIRIAPFLILAALTGCATLPAGPSVTVLPAKGKSFEQFQTEDGSCRQWAERQLSVPVKETYEKSTATGAAAGTAVGAGVGALFGSASGHTGAGAAIGAATGLLFGSAIGSDAGAASAREAQHRYDNAYVQCMYSYGNQIPGQHAAQRAARAAAPPPPPVAEPAPVAVAEPSRTVVVEPPPRTVIVEPPPRTVIVERPPRTVVVEEPPPVVVVERPQRTVVVEQVPPPVMAPDPAYAAAPDLYLDEAPRFLYSPDLGMYVAVGVPYDLVYNGRDYFYFYGGNWYRSRYYTGPWVYTPRSAYPPAFARYRMERIRHFREAEYNRYLRDRRNYQGRMHRPDFRGHGPQPYRGPGQGHDPGRERG
ncbi:MAG TPA: YMGG-like glycine zipper-containing protein [Geomonas sp.]|nr:YMGG-like glycine zipper-containing protein [Geomonas sp.]